MPTVRYTFTFEAYVDHEIEKDDHANPIYLGTEITDVQARARAALCAGEFRVKGMVYDLLPPPEAE